MYRSFAVYRAFFSQQGSHFKKQAQNEPPPLQLPKIERNLKKSFFFLPQRRHLRRLWICGKLLLRGDRPRFLSFAGHHYALFFFPFLPFSLSFLLHSPPLLFISDSRPIHVSSVSSPRASRPCPLSPPLLLLRIFTCPPPLPAHRGRQHSNTPYGLKNHCFCLACRFFNYLC